MDTGILVFLIVSPRDLERFASGVGVGHMGGLAATGDGGRSNKLLILFCKRAKY